MLSDNRNFGNHRPELKTFPAGKVSYSETYRIVIKCEIHGSFTFCRDMAR